MKSLEISLKKILENISDTAFQLSEEALSEASQILKKSLEKNSPKKTGKYSKNWIIKKYKGIRYIGNATTAKKTDIPLINILEFSPKKSNPHIDKSIKLVETQILSIFDNKMRKI